MNKICTSLEQSQKLIEMGIDINTADMLWTYDFTVNDINGLNVISEQLKPEENDIPAWSLAALFKVISNIFKYNLDYNGTSFILMVGDFEVSNKAAVDACVEMIEKLHEQKLL